MTEHVLPPTDARDATIENPVAADQVRVIRGKRWFLHRRPRLNPILRRELRVRMRGGRAFLVLGIYLLCVTAAIYGIERIVLRADYYGQLQSFQVGQIIFAGLALSVVGLLLLVVPALTATAITTEREQATFDLLRGTPVRAHTIVFGKLLSALSYAALLVVATIPPAAVVFLFGGVAPRDLWAVFGLLGVVVIAFGTLGLFASAVLRRTGAAVVLAYMLTAALVGGSTVVYVFLDAVDGGLIDQNTVWFEEDMGMRGEVIVADEPDMGVDPAGRPDFQAMVPSQPPRWLLALNPVVAMADLVATSIDPNPGEFGFGGSSVPVVGMWIDVFRVGTRARPMDVQFDNQGRPILPEMAALPLWRLTTIVYGVLSAVMLLITIFLLGRRPGMRRHRWRRENT